MKIKITKRFTFEMAHKLSSSYSKECQNIHGHSYKLEVTLESAIKEDGMIMDFKKLKELVNPIIVRFDHQYITEKDFGMNPTAENMAVHIFNNLKKRIPILYSVKLWETENSFVEVSW